MNIKGLILSEKEMESISKFLNSRAGLAIVVAAGFSLFIYPEIRGIRSDMSTIVAEVREARRVAEAHSNVPGILEEMRNKIIAICGPKYKQKTDEGEEENR